MSRVDVGESREMDRCEVLTSFQLYYLIQKRFFFHSEDFLTTGGLEEMQQHFRTPNRLLPEDLTHGKTTVWKVEYVTNVVEVSRKYIEECVLTENNFRGFLAIVSPMLESDLDRATALVKTHSRLGGMAQELARSTIYECADELIVELLKPPIPPEESDRIKKHFESVDRNEQGYVCLNQFSDDVSLSGVEFDYYDLNGDGLMQLREFEALMCSEEYRNFGTIWRCVARTMDRKLVIVKQGKSIYDQSRMLPTLPELGRKLLMECFQTLDTEGRGLVSYDVINTRMKLIGTMIKKIDPEHNDVDFERFMHILCPDAYKVRPNKARLNRPRRANVLYDVAEVAHLTSNFVVEKMSSFATAVGVKGRKSRMEPKEDSADRAPRKSNFQNLLEEEDY